MPWHLGHMFHSSSATNSFTFQSAILQKKINYLNPLKNCLNIIFVKLRGLVTDVAIANERTIKNICSKVKPNPLSYLETSTKYLESSAYNIYTQLQNT